MSETKISDSDEEINKSFDFFIFFSKEQKKSQDDKGQNRVFAKLKTGEIIAYTEMNRKNEPNKDFGDSILLGVGRFDHTE